MKPPTRHLFIASLTCSHSTIVVRLLYLHILHSLGRTGDPPTGHNVEPLTEHLPESSCVQNRWLVNRPFSKTLKLVFRPFEVWQIDDSAAEISSAASKHHDCQACMPQLATRRSAVTRFDAYAGHSRVGYKCTMVVNIHWILELPHRHLIIWRFDLLRTRPLGLRGYTVWQWNTIWRDMLF